MLSLVVAFLLVLQLLFCFNFCLLVHRCVPRLSRDEARLRYDVSRAFRNLGLYTESNLALNAALQLVGFAAGAVQPGPELEATLDALCARQPSALAGGSSGGGGGVAGGSDSSVASGTAGTWVDEPKRRSANASTTAGGRGFFDQAALALRAYGMRRAPSQENGAAAVPASSSDSSEGLAAVAAAAAAAGAHRLRLSASSGDAAGAAAASLGAEGERVLDEQAGGDAASVALSPEEERMHQAMEAFELYAQNAVRTGQSEVGLFCAIKAVEISERVRRWLHAETEREQKQSLFPAAFGAQVGFFPSFVKGYALLSVYCSALGYPRQARVFGARTAELVDLARKHAQDGGRRGCVPRVHMEMPVLARSTASARSVSRVVAWLAQAAALSAKCDHSGAASRHGVDRQRPLGQGAPVHGHLHAQRTRIQGP